MNYIQRLSASHRHRISVVSDALPSIASLQARFDFSDISTLWQDTGGTTQVNADGQKIQRIDDLSGNGYNATELVDSPTYKASIQNSLSVGRFDGTDDVLQGTAISNLIAADAYTIMAAVKYTTVGGGGIAGYDNEGFLSDAGGYWGTMAYTGQAGAYNYDGTSDIAVASYTAGNWMLIQTAHRSGNIEVRINGGAATSTASGNTLSLASSMLLGRHYNLYYFDGDLGEALIYNTALSLSDINNVGDYLATKWGLSWTTAT